MATYISTNSGTATSTTLTFSFTSPDAATYITVQVRAGAAITGVTYNGAAMAEIKKANNSTTVYCGIFGIVNTTLDNCRKPGELKGE